MPESLLTVGEAAQLKGVTIAAIYAAVKENRLPHTRVLQRIGVKKADLIRWNPRSYAGRPGAKSGRPKGIPMSVETKSRIAAAQKKRWARLKQAR